MELINLRKVVPSCRFVLLHLLFQPSLHLRVIACSHLCCLYLSSDEVHSVSHDVLTYQLQIERHKVPTQV
jgi:hypothetical protein